ncbi:hypothetical protein HRbin36_02574 [bacterium HR36]|nr:hypothetical protein HRbin36_02574 [bacterium HR36]
MTVIAHRVYGVTAPDNYWLFPVPQAEHSQVRINLSFGCTVNIPRGTVANPGHFAVGQNNATVGSDTLDTCLAPADVCHRFGAVHARLSSFGYLGYRPFKKLSIAYPVPQPLGIEQLLGVQVKNGGIMLVHGSKENPRR